MYPESGYTQTFLDTLCEGRLSFLEISTFPEMLIYSTPTISSNFWDFRVIPEVLLFTGIR